MCVERETRGEKKKKDQQAKEMDQKQVYVNEEEQMFDELNRPILIRGWELFAEIQHDVKTISLPKYTLVAVEECRIRKHNHTEEDKRCTKLEVEVSQKHSVVVVGKGDGKVYEMEREVTDKQQFPFFNKKESLKDYFINSFAERMTKNARAACLQDLIYQREQDLSPTEN